MHKDLTRGHRRLTNDEFDQCQKEKKVLIKKTLFSFRHQKYWEPIHKINPVYEGINHYRQFLQIVVIVSINLPQSQEGMHADALFCRCSFSIGMHALLKL